MDVLAEVLESMRTGRPSSVRTDGYAPWGLGVKGSGFHVVLHGGCWLVPLDGTAPTALGTGDVVFLLEGGGHLLADDPATPASEVTAKWLNPGSPVGTLAFGGGGPRTRLLCGRYHLDRARRPPLLGTLPEMILLRAGGHPELTAAVGLLGSELDRPRCGSESVVTALVDSLLLYILRAWLESSDGSWASALRDPAVSAALTAMHDDPAAPWTVESLARRSGLSRSPFAKRFAALVGEPPLTYLTRWRMSGAARLLRESDVPLSAVAGGAGYSSEYAFAKAFKREYGVAPGRYRRHAVTP
ncbi:AraC family transcriptional regulator [Umezawaea sp. Da 62-37]|uniref:AraC family transcriptional regulator n=1 Tax=Umezawaea sp. Da 62-37 TaxID=3075927 RepID=UPI0028F6F407|nr:AraC family transcriptional regulator [Umezawaea sp. Da 62-37]WNV84388.1 AraC family transcriptional regulator [Umezawaea sp. Da 62-37]